MDYHWFETYVPRNETLHALEALAATGAVDICATFGEIIPGHEHNFFIITDEPGCRDSIEKAYHSEECLSLQVPEWLSSNPDEQISQVEAWIAEIEKQAGEILQSLEEKKRDPAVIAAMADIERLVWYLKHTTHLASVRKLCHITGWTMAENEEFLQGAFRRSDIHGAIRFASPPEFSRIPVNMHQPWWAKPFLFIQEMLGTPDSTEIDSGKLLPIIVPLLFGYMFPDIGHGLMQVLLSAILYRRWPAGRFLIPCGLSAMLFGLVFGEVFALEGVLDPLWISPLEHPLEVLLAPLVFGAALSTAILRLTDGIQRSPACHATGPGPYLYRHPRGAGGICADHAAGAV